VTKSGTSQHVTTLQGRRKDKEKKEDVKKGGMKGTSGGMKRKVERHSSLHLCGHSYFKDKTASTKKPTRHERNAGSCNRLTGPELLNSSYRYRDQLNKPREMRVISAAV
jgi:hypothetical protein